MSGSGSESLSEDMVYFAGLRTWFIAIEYEPILTNIYIAIWCRLGTIGFNQ